MIFVDSSFWIAQLASDDNSHNDAVALWSVVAGRPLVTSNHVRGETWTFVGRRYGHRPAVTFLDQLERSRLVRVERVTRRQEDEALRWLRRHDEREYSFVDATSFALMRALRISEALAFDRDFTAAGFVELRP